MKQGWLLPVLLAICPMVQATESTESAQAAHALADAVGTHELVLLGEMHGTREIPQLTGVLVARYARTEPVLLALEVAAVDQPRVDAFLDSGGSDADFAAVLAGEHWQGMHDGRDSVAMLGLLEHMRRLRAGGADVSVALIDAPGDGDRDERMANALREAMTAHPEARTLVLTGNVHAMTGEPPTMVLPDGTPYKAPTTLGRHLLDLSPLSIDIQAEAGEFWGCQQTCGPHPAGSRLPGRDTMQVVPAGGSWDLRLMLPRFHASVPAVRDGANAR